jgi:hypothetical protein
MKGPGGGTIPLGDAISPWVVPPHRVWRDGPLICRLSTTSGAAPDTAAEEGNPCVTASP